MSQLIKKKTKKKLEKHILFYFCIILMISEQLKIIEDTDNFLPGAINCINVRYK